MIKTNKLLFSIAGVSCIVSPIAFVVSCTGTNYSLDKNTCSNDYFITGDLTSQLKNVEFDLGVYLPIDKNITEKDITIYNSDGTNAEDYKVKSVVPITKKETNTQSSSNDVLKVYRVTFQTKNVTSGSTSFTFKLFDSGIYKLSGNVAYNNREIRYTNNLDPQQKGKFEIEIRRKIDQGSIVKVEHITTLTQSPGTNVPVEQGNKSNWSDLVFFNDGATSYFTNQRRIINYAKYDSTNKSIKLYGENLPQTKDELQIVDDQGNMFDLKNVTYTFSNQNEATLTFSSTTGSDIANKQYVDISLISRPGYAHCSIKEKNENTNSIQKAYATHDKTTGDIVLTLYGEKIEQTNIDNLLIRTKKTNTQPSVILNQQDQNNVVSISPNKDIATITFKNLPQSISNSFNGDIEIFVDKNKLDNPNFVVKANFYQLEAMFKASYFSSNQSATVEEEFILVAFKDIPPATQQPQNPQQF